MKGVIKKVVIEKGFGFILGEDGREYFFHYSAIKNGSLREDISGHSVEFEDTFTNKGPRAEDVFLD